MCVCVCVCATIRISQEILCFPYAEFFFKLEGTARYAGFLLAPPKGLLPSAKAFWNNNNLWGLKRILEPYGWLERYSWLERYGWLECFGCHCMSPAL